MSFVYDCMRVSLIAMLAVFCVALPASAAAQDCVAPPGTSAIDQYCETVPTAVGDRGGGLRGGSRPISEQTRQALIDAGPIGAALAQQLQVEEPPPGKTRRGASSNGDRETKSSARAKAPATASIPGALDPAFSPGLLIVVAIATFALLAWYWHSRVRAHN